MRKGSDRTLAPRFRMFAGQVNVLGPGKADLLGAIAETGSLAAAARALGMSYTRAWKLMRALNQSFREPLVELERGGSRRGGARLTPMGARVLDLYREIEAVALSAAEAPWRRLRRLLR